MKDYKILVVEDDVDILNITKLSLEEIGGYSVAIAYSGYEAINQLSTVTPNLILLDMMMPKLDGKATLMKIKEIDKFKNIPIIFITAKTRQHDIDECLSLGAIGVITKPFDPLQLPKLISDIIEGHYEK